MDDYQESPLWKKAFSPSNDGWDTQRKILEAAYAHFRERVSHLVAQIHKDMPSLTVHDITHIDALWWTASEIAGPEYSINPAEAFVLGGAFLLHDAAHCIAAFPGGIEEIRALPEWRTFAGKIGANGAALSAGSEQFQMVLFDVLRTMHPKKARDLAKVHWAPSGDSASLFLLPHDELRRAYADAIGQIAQSHWSHPHELESLSYARVNPPACIHPASWVVDVLKLAILLRTADVAHIDAQRAPYFLFALVQPGGASSIHWSFQSRIHKVKRDADPLRNDLGVSGSAFPASEQDAWWMAYDAARMIDQELRAADRLLLDHRRQRFAARSVAFSYSPEAFATNVPTDGWHPVDTSIKITDIKSMVERFGGEKLYGKDPASALRELLQNSIDAVHACRELGGLGEEEGEVEVAIEDVSDGHWIHITDTGIGMSRYVITEILLDFGRSLWRSTELQGEWSSLSGTQFEAIGQFGIGFFSIFMLGDRVRVLTRRYEPKEGESAQWLLEFTAGTNKRPILRNPSDEEKLKRHGTKVSVLISSAKLIELCQKKSPWLKSPSRLTMAEICAQLAPAIDINLYIRPPSQERQCIVKANDWLTLSPLDLLKRLFPSSYGRADVNRFGDWSHLSEVRSISGKVFGRCAVQPNTLYSSVVGIGVVKGLFAGFIPGVVGVVFSRPQNDLARKTAIPDVTSLDIQTWAEEQKTLLISLGAIDKARSALLARLGVGYTDLILGDFGGNPISYEELISEMSEDAELKVHHDVVNHESSDDVTESNFDSSFRQESDLLELESYPSPSWLDEIVDESGINNLWSLDAALQSALCAAWGEVLWSDRENNLVGTVGGEGIYRMTKVASKKSNIDLFDL